MSIHPLLRLRNVNAEIVIGENLTGKGTNTAFIGGTNGAYNAANNSAWTTTSDQRIKKNITDNNIGLSIIEKIQVRNFEYRTREEIEDNVLKLASGVVIQKTGNQIGVIAQELEEICPTCVLTQANTVKTINTDELFWHLINAVKELSEEIKILKNNK